VLSSFGVKDHENTVFSSHPLIVKVPGIATVEWELPVNFILDLGVTMVACFASGFVA
jgi:hypothetical protein